MIHLMLQHLFIIIRMKQQKQAVQTKIAQILSKLHSKSIDDLLNFQFFNIQNISKSTNLHPSIVQEYISKLQKLLSVPFGVSGGQGLQIDVGRILKHWASQDSYKYYMDVPLILQMQVASQQLAKKELNFKINKGDIIQIIGRPNSGKSLFMIELVSEYLRQGKHVIYLDSYRNKLKLKNKLEQYEERVLGLDRWQQRLKIFDFNTITELATLLHAVGKHILQGQQGQGQREYVFCVDCMSRVQWVDSQGIQGNNSTQFKMIEKLKRLLFNLSEKIGTVLYTYRMPNNFTLFQTAYKPDRVRPKATNNNSKLWDSIALKTICLDYTATKEQQEIMRVHLPKGIDCKVYQFIRKERE